MNCQDHRYRDQDPSQVSRRWFLEQCGLGLGTMALGQLLTEAGYAADVSTTKTSASTTAGVNPLAPRAHSSLPRPSG